MKRVSVYIRGMWRFIVVEKYVAYSPERNANDGWTVCDESLWFSPCFFIGKNDQSQSRSISSDLHKLYETGNEADVCERMQQLCI